MVLIFWGVVAIGLVLLTIGLTLRPGVEKSALAGRHPPSSPFTPALTASRIFAPVGDAQLSDFNKVWALGQKCIDRWL